MNTSTTAPVVAGWDASPEAQLALQRAHERALEHGLPLQVLIARGDIGRASRWADEWSRGLAEEWSELARKQLAELGRPDLVPEVREGTPAEVLVEETRTASCVVVGAGGHGPIFGRLLGSVSQHLTRHAAGPVLVVRSGGVDAGPVVAGVDGSSTSLRALAFALREGEVRGVPVEVLYVPPRLAGWAYLEGATSTELAHELEADEARVRAHVAQVLAAHRGVRASVRTPSGSAAHELARASEAASLVVVGSRGAGGFAGLLLGSVANAVLHRSHCPVAVIH